MHRFAPACLDAFLYDRGAAAIAGHCPTRHWRAESQALKTTVVGRTCRTATAKERDMSSTSRGASAAQGEAKPAPAGPRDLGPMPVWDLSDLYPGPNSKAVQGDLK